MSCSLSVVVEGVVVSDADLHRSTCTVDLVAFSLAGLDEDRQQDDPAT